MATYLYCVLAPPKVEAFPNGLVGIGQSPVRSLVLPEDRLEAWVATIEEETLRASGRELAAQALLHNAVIDAALSTDRTPAPARYGSRFTDDAACLADIARRLRDWRVLLNRIAGAVEMSVLIVPARREQRQVDTPRLDEPAAGRRYLEAVRARVQHELKDREGAEETANQVATIVAGITRQESRSLRPSGVLSVAHLVDRREIERYRTAVGSLSSTAFRLVVAGPRAPYSFLAQSPDFVGHDSGSPNRDE